MQPAPGRASTGNRRGARDIEQRAQYECALVHAWMRHGKTWLPQAASPEQEQIEVERARRIARLATAPAAVPALDGVEARQQRAGLKLGAQRRDRVDIIRLRRAHSDRCA